MAHVPFLYGNDERSSRKKLNFVKPQFIAFAKGARGSDWMVAAMNWKTMLAGNRPMRGTVMVAASSTVATRRDFEPSDTFVGGSGR